MTWAGIVGVRRTAFICGCGHTGTTILARILSAHPDIFMLPKETGMFLSGSAPRVWYRVLRYRRQAARAGKRVFLEKTPRHIYKVGLIRRVAPGSRIIVTVRDGRDVVASLAARMNGDVDGAMARWLADTTASMVVLARRNTILVRYEELIEDPTGTLQRLCEFVGVAYTPEILAYHLVPQHWYGRKDVRLEVDASENGKRRNWQVNQPLFDGRGRGLRELAPETLRKFAEPEARALLENFGYSLDEEIAA